MQIKPVTTKLHIRFSSAIFLAFFWCSGLCVGANLAFHSSDSVSLLLRSAVLQKASVVQIIAVLLLPLFVTFLFLMLSIPGCILLLAFLKAAGLSYLLIGILIAYGNAGWLISLLLLFSDFLSAVFLVQIWLKVLQKKTRYSDFLINCTCIVLIGILDCYVVSPFLATLFNVN